MVDVNTDWQEEILGWYPVLIKYRLVNPAILKFIIYEIDWNLNTPNIYVFRDEKELKSTSDPITDIKDAESYIKGFIKFDHCVNLEFTCQDRNIWLYFYDVTEVDKLNKLLKYIWQLGEREIPSWLNYNENI